MPSLPPLPETRLTDREREALAAGWPDFWQVHAAVERILTERVTQARREGVAELEAVHARYFDLDLKPGDAYTNPEPEDVWRYDRDFRAALGESGDDA